MSYKYLLIIFSFLFFSIPINAADDWTQQSPPSNPQSRNSHEMAYIGDDNVIIFGGVSASHVRIGDTRIYDLSLDSWISMSPGLSPSSRSDFGMAYIGDDKALLFGGNDGNVDGESWCYDVSDGTWSDVGALTPEPPVAREALRLAYIGTDRVLLFGGLSGSTYFDETWWFDYSDGIWTKMTPASAPSGRHSHNMAYIGDDKVLLFGGNVSGTVNNETWVYDWSDNAWTNMNPATAPSARTNHSMSYIGDDKVILLGSSNADGTTWIYDLSDNIWTIDTNSSTPPGRLGAAMAISSLSGERRVVHFGGRDSALDFTNETWTFGGGDYLAPEINIRQGTTDIGDPGIYDYGCVAVGAAIDVVFTVENTGTQNLTIDPLILGGTNPGDFGIPAQPISPVVPGGTTTFEIRFDPTTSGDKSATVAITNNDSDENPYNITIFESGIVGTTPLGSGTSGDPYQISTLAELTWIYDNSCSWDSYFEQTADIDASITSTWGGGVGTSGWNPIGTDGDRFSGSYDGQNNFISDLHISRWTSGGLFGYLENATIQNIELPSVDINTPAQSAGALAANNNGGTIINCWSSGSIISLRHAGGLVCTNHNGGIISNSYSDANVAPTGDGGFCRGGGLVSSNETSSTIDNCYASGTVTAYEMSGGLVANNSVSTITNSYCWGTVVGGQNSGGFVGSNGWSTINACYSRSNVSGGGYRVGGFVGEAGAGSNITNCYSLGDVTRNTGSSESTYGAFAGRKDGVIHYCYSIGSVTYTDATDPTDKGFVGGHIGGTYDSNFWDSEASNQLTSTGATAKTTAQMKNHQTFTDYTDGSDGLGNPVWDFVTNPYDDIANNDYWDIDYTPSPPKVRALSKPMGINDSYPFLDFQNGNDTALPVELSNFTVENTLLGVQSSWTTESEIENLGFILERRTAYVDWTEIASYKTDNTLLGQGTTSNPTNYEYIDKLVEPNTIYEYRLADVDYNGVVTYHSVRTVKVVKAPLSSKVEKFIVLPAYPNPFNPSTAITYGLDKDSDVSIKIYDITGKLINDLLNSNQKQGWHSTIWNGTDNDNNQVPAGIYLSRITSNNEVKTTKLMLLK